jgi:hypothetical protein
MDINKYFYITKKLDGMTFVLRYNEVPQLV